MNTYIILYLCIGVAYGVIHILYQSRTDKFKESIAVLRESNAPMVTSFAISLLACVAISFHAVFWPITVTKHAFLKK